MSVPLALDKTAVRTSFTNVVDSYNSAAALQRRVGENLYAQIKRPTLAESLVLDIGCGTGFLSSKLVDDYAQIIALDIALAMVKKTQSELLDQKQVKYLCADAEALALCDHSVDCIVSNLALQWCQDLESLYSECHRVLKPKSLLRFSTFGLGTLTELKASWAKVDDYPHVNHFVDASILINALSAAGFNNIKLQTEISISQYKSVLDLMRELKGLGAHNVNQGRIRTLTGTKRMQKMIQVYAAYEQQGLIPATFEIFYVEAETSQE